MKRTKGRQRKNKPKITNGRVGEQHGGLNERTTDRPKRPKRRTTDQTTS